MSNKKIRLLSFREVNGPIVKIANGPIVSGGTLVRFYLGLRYDYSSIVFKWKEVGFPAGCCHREAGFAL